VRRVKALKLSRRALSQGALRQGTNNEKGHCKFSVTKPCVGTKEEGNNGSGVGLSHKPFPSPKFVLMGEGVNNRRIKDEK